MEDHPLFRQGLVQMVRAEKALTVCGQASAADQALKDITRLMPDLALVDISLPGKSGLDLIKELRAVNRKVKILVVSMHDEALYAERVLRAGARGYITKHETSREVMAAIRKVLGGQIYLGKRMASRVLESFASHPVAGKGVAQLTDRELEIFELIGRGRTTREISSCLHLGTSTIDTYRTRIKAKLNLENASQLSHEAIRWVSAGQKAPV